MTTNPADARHRLNAPTAGVGFEVPSDPNVIHILALTDAAVAELELHSVGDIPTSSIDLDMQVDQAIGDSGMGSDTDIARSNLGRVFDEIEWSEAA